MVHGFPVTVALKFNAKKTGKRAMVLSIKLYIVCVYTYNTSLMPKVKFSSEHTFL